ncbi:hypothetical protein HBI56_016390 [Parastagonospora nodorum]|uniref:Uncharacterized protein n=1 Tax=Phaeosphaeria nodorum (strain SN15 / ATCC MYA-4574 / FGSC 10173) TaxID=321614 RepID=A0A7U2I1X9_PHANO|nr:hypothetical protein HBH56_083600 [Parastagonospora nodorum]QRC96751.1 hypothetical protein JI435_434080 [Parastagonospora nodorum SN15]KAH3929736.1 hypothetical protein HBH54_118220 [Parastagonospora nodorum]KAH3955231.1 hypothetical protein HBH53_006330 [Parastagonospora nodorum]KAH3976896.1 hypothetical protein HBH51_075170 [Parastagonospora nodorum]
MAELNWVSHRPLHPQHRGRQSPPSINARGANTTCSLPDCPSSPTDASPGVPQLSGSRERPLFGPGRDWGCGRIKIITRRLTAARMPGTWAFGPLKSMSRIACADVVDDSWVQQLRSSSLRNIFQVPTPWALELFGLCS